MKHFKLTNREEDLLRRKFMELNQLRMKYDHPPLGESKILHQLIAVALPKLTINRAGELIIDED